MKRKRKIEQDISFQIYSECLEKLLKYCEDEIDFENPLENLKVELLHVSYVDLIIDFIV